MIVPMGYQWLIISAASAAALQCFALSKVPSYCFGGDHSLRPMTIRYLSVHFNGRQRYLGVPAKFVVEV